MSRFTRLITCWAVSFALAALIVAVPLDAQSRSADAQASTLVVAHLTLARFQDMILGSPSGNFASGFVTSSDVGAQPAQWNGTTDPGDNIQVQFTSLPSVLTGPGGTTIPFHCGTAAGIISGGSGGGFFNPTTSAGISGPISSSGNFVVTLGANGSPGPNDNNCSADVTGVRPGVYSATITLTATVL